MVPRLSSMSDMENAENFHFECRFCVVKTEAVGRTKRETWQVGGLILVNSFLCSPRFFVYRFYAVVFHLVWGYLGSKNLQISSSPQAQRPAAWTAQLKIMRPFGEGMGKTWILVSHG